MSKQTFTVGAEKITPKDDPTVDVVFEGGQPLPPGQHQFQLIVEDETGNRSQPATVTVNVVTVLTANLIGPPAPVNFNAGFRLDGSKSVALGAAIKAFHWTLLR